MALNVPYTIRLAKALAPLGLKWIEEFLPPDDYDGYREVKEALAGSGVLTTTGEHEYSRYGFRRLIADKAVDVLQPDITWLGGMTEARRIVAMASAYDLPDLTRGSSAYSRPDPSPSPSPNQVRHPRHPARLVRLLVPSAVRVRQLPDRGVHQPRARRR